MRVAVALLLLILAVPVWAQVTPRGYAGNDSGGVTATSFQSTLPAGVADGDVCLVTLGESVVQTITPPSGWTDAGAGLVTWNTTEGVETFVSVCAAGSCASGPTFTFLATDITSAAACYKGVKQTSPVDKTASRVNTASASSAANSITPTTGNNGELFVHIHARSADRKSVV